MTIPIHHMRLELEKLALAAPAPAQPGKAQQYMPWYSAAGLGAVGHHVAGKLVPKKYRFLGQLAGTVAGTGVGVHAGEAIGKRLDQRKMANVRPDGLTDRQWVSEFYGNREHYRELQKQADFEDEHGTGGPPTPTKKEEHPAMTVAKSLAGFGTGMGAGYLAAKGVNAALKRSGIGEIPRSVAYKAIPIMTGLGGLAYTAAQQRTLDKMRSSHLERQKAKT